MNCNNNNVVDFPGDPSANVHLTLCLPELKITTYSQAVEHSPTSFPTLFEIVCRSGSDHDATLRHDHTGKCGVDLSLPVHHPKSLLVAPVRSPTIIIDGCT